MHVRLISPGNKEDNCICFISFVDFKAVLMSANTHTLKHELSYEVESGSEITPGNKIDKSLVVHRFTGNVMTSITTLRTY